MEPKIVGSPVLSTLYRGLDVIEFLGQGPATIAKISKETGFSRQNVYRMLKTAAAHGWVVNGATDDVYQVSTRLWAFAVKSFRLGDVRDTFSGILEGLARETGESVHLSTYEDGKVVYIDMVDGWQPISSNSKLGVVSPAHSTATGKCLLTCLSDSRLEAFLARDLESFTDQTITSPAEMREELATVTSNGYAINRGEWHKDVAGVAVLAAKLPDGKAVALGFQGPKERIISTADDLIARLRSAVAVAGLGDYV